MAAKNSWVTVVYDEETCLHALVLANCLRRIITTADIVAVAPDYLPESFKRLLSEVFDAFLEFAILKNENSPNLRVLDAGKIFAWSLTWYKKCVVLDPSIFILKNCDELFGHEGNILLCRSTKNPMEYDSQIMVIEPAYDYFISLKQCFDGPSGQNLTLCEIIRKGLPYENIIALEKGTIEMVNSTLDTFTPTNAPKMWNFANAKPWLMANQSDSQQKTKFKEMWMKMLTSEVIHFISNAKSLPKGLMKTLVNQNNHNITTTNGISKSYHNNLKNAIAIIGQSCRLPGANGVDEFWRLLESGGDGITSIPMERLQEYQHSDPRFTSIKAGFLKCPINEFDAKFFEISPREAAFMDPQQRLMVEVAWEALEDAAINPSKLKGGNTGVFSGVWTHDYERVLNDNTTGKDFHHVILGNAFSATSARVSCFLGLNGPNVSTESGCSSSMVALHLACDSLRKQETDLALATGVNLLIHHIPHCEVPILAKDGHCKTFDENADGFARAEGVVVVVLKIFSDAVRDEDRILSIVRGSALSNEGTTSSFGTPSQFCQEIAIRDALKAAGVRPAEVDYVEAHGTGTPIGDPIEFAAISASYKAQRVNPMIIGSAKTNTGHTESAAGLVGLLKVNLAMEKEAIPPHRNLNSINPNIDLNDLPAQIPLSAVAWNRSPVRKRLAGVSCFGISGTNVHVILEEPPHISKFEIHTQIRTRTHNLLTLSAKTENALKGLADDYLAHFNEHPELSLDDICYTGNVGRQHMKYRLALVARDVKEMKKKLEKPPPSVATITSEKYKIAFLFTGQGSQYNAMAKTLYETSSIFQNALKACDNILKNNGGIPITEIVFSCEDSVNIKLDETIYSQTSIFCIEYGLLKMWKNFGVKPDYVLGHSVGEFAAAVAAGVMSLEDALTLVVKRSQLIQNLPEGGMLVVRTNRENVINLIESFCQNNPGDWLDIAVINSSEEVVLAGAKHTLNKFSEFCCRNNVKSQHLAASHAFHSREMEPILKEFGAAADKITFKHSTCKYISGFTGKHLSEGDINSEYWQSHARNTVDFTKGIKLLHSEGCNIFIEIGAHPVLLALGMSNVPPLEIQNSLWLPSIRRNEENWVTLSVSISKLYEHGMDIDWERFNSDYVQRRKVILPHYSFQRQKYWIESKSEPLTKPLHPLLGRKVPLAVGKDHVFQNDLNLSDFSYLSDHQVANVIVLPGAGFLEIIVAAGKEVLKDDLNSSNILVEDFFLEALMELEENKSHKIQVVASEIEKSDRLLVTVFLYKKINGYNEEKGWKQFASARVSVNKLNETQFFLKRLDPVVWKKCL